MLALVLVGTCGSGVPPRGLRGVCGAGARSDAPRRPAYGHDLLLIAGNETSTNLLGNCPNALRRHPEAFARVWADPGMIPQAVEEMLRFDSPVQLTTRQPKVDLPVGRAMVRAGNWGCFVIGAPHRASGPDCGPREDRDKFDLRGLKTLPVRC